MEDQLYDELSKKIKQRLYQELNQIDNSGSLTQGMNIENLVSIENSVIHSRDYLEFKKLFMPKNLSLYEKLCKTASKYFPQKITDNSLKEEIKKKIKRCHLNIEPEDSLSFTYFYSFVLFFILATFSLLFGLILQDANAIMTFLFGSIVVSGFAFFVFNNLLDYFSNNWMMKASNYTIQSLFYVVTYLKHTPNLERAIDFTAEHLPPPLSLDFKRILWDVETGIYSTVEESINAYLLSTWQKDNPAYVEAFSLVVAALKEGNKEQRDHMLDRALQLLLDGTYEKMLKYSHDLQQQITTVHMLGVVLPLLAIVMLPLVLSFSQSIRWYHVALLYDIFIPMIVYWKTKQISSTRPGFGTLSTDEIKMAVKKSNRVNENFIIMNAAFLLVVFLLIGFSPVTLLKVMFPDDVILFKIGNINVKLMDFRTMEDGSVRGPYSFISAFIGSFAILGIAISAGLLFKGTTDELIKIRNKTLKVEEEFVSVLYQLANRLSDGLPVELAFQQMASSLPESSETKKFFQLVTFNLNNRGMRFDQALYDDQHGALVQYPSPLIKSSMKILTDAAKKGPTIAGTAMMYIADYLKQIKTVNRRIKDLLAENLSNMKSVISMVGPILTAVIAGIGSMITTIIITLKDFMSEISTGASSGGIMNLLNYGVPAYYSNIAVGIYVLTIIYILSELVSVIENGPDEILKKNYIGNNFIKHGVKFALLTGMLTAMFSFIALMFVGRSF